MLTAENALIMLEYAKREAKKFTEFEEMFTASIVRLKRLNNLRALSTKQEEIVQKIYARHTGAPDKVYREKIG